VNAAQTIPCPNCQPCKHCQGTGRVVPDDVQGAELRHLRDEARLSIRAVARAMGVSHAYLGDLETGHRAWRPALIKRFMDALHELEGMRGDGE
jgi:predicted transcriptional regulator